MDSRMGRPVQPSWDFALSATRGLCSPTLGRIGQVQGGGAIPLGTKLLFENQRHVFEPQMAGHQQVAISGGLARLKGQAMGNGDVAHVDHREPDVRYAGHLAAQQALHRLEGQGHALVEQRPQDQAGVAGDQLQALIGGLGFYKVPGRALGEGLALGVGRALGGQRPLFLGVHVGGAVDDGGGGGGHHHPLDAGVGGCFEHAQGAVDCRADQLGLVVGDEEGRGGVHDGVAASHGLGPAGVPCEVGGHQLDVAKLV